MAVEIPNRSSFLYAVEIPSVGGNTLFKALGHPLAAQAGRADEVAALAADGLVWVAGERLGKYADAHEAAENLAAQLGRNARTVVDHGDLDVALEAHC